MPKPSHDDRIYAMFLYDLGPILKERAFQHKANRDAAAPASEERLFNDGLVLGFNEVISILQQQADSFQIRRQDLRLEDIDPDRDLL